MRAEDVQPFLSRRWDLVEAEKLAARAERFWREGPIGCLRASEALWAEARKRGVVSDRAEDLRGHIAYRMLLDRIERRVRPR